MKGFTRPLLSIDLRDDEHSTIHLNEDLVSFWQIKVQSASKYLCHVSVSKLNPFSIVSRNQTTNLKEKSGLATRDYFQWQS